VGEPFALLGWIDSELDQEAVVSRVTGVNRQTSPSVNRWNPKPGYSIHKRYVARLGDVAYALRIDLNRYSQVPEQEK
jgi:hypothetical protein